MIMNLEIDYVNTYDVTFMQMVISLINRHQEIFFTFIIFFDSIQ